ncbi:MAG: lysoplasmalogenase [Desulfobacteraceae bacterium]|nr:lysoplasmalogenase [Desulfobacteraceae bacterium]
MTWIILIVSAILLIFLLMAEKKENFKGRLIFKPLLSVLFVIVAGLGPWPMPTYAAWVLAGLVLSWFGDFFLIFQSDKMFLSGLISFLLGHVCYALGFFLHGQWGLLSAAGLAGMLVLGAVIFNWLRPHLGQMTGPVIGYILIISAMVGGALALFSAPQAATAGRWLVLCGAQLFYASDIFVARDRFVKPGFDNRLIGLPLYYAAQFLFAFSVGMI